MKKFTTSFKDMPVLMKLIFILYLYSLLENIVNLFLFKSITPTYFGFTFPVDFSFVWYIYEFITYAAAIYVFLKRSYSIVKIYVNTLLGILAISLSNSIYVIIHATAGVQVIMILLYSLTYVLTGLIYFYLLRQKKYFNKV
jgi:hypothetical protein